MATTARKSRRSKTTRKVGPSAAKLKQLAKTRRPPQRWFDETENPFKPSRK